MQGDPMWLEEPQEPTRRGLGSRRWLVLVIAAIPWAIVAALVLLPRDTPHEPPSAVAPELGPAPTASPEPTDRAADPSVDTADDPAVPSTPPDGATSPERRTPPSSGAATLPESSEASAAARDRLAATATVIARAWLTGVAPHLGAGGLEPVDATSYAEHLAVEAIEHRDPHLAVVSLLAVLVREDPDGLVVDHRRVAVPLAVDDDRVHPVGSPWWLPAPDLDAVELPAEELTDPGWVEAAVDGLLAAGLEDVEVRRLARTSRWPWRADVVATTPEGERIDGPVWLRWTEHGFQLAGLTQPAEALAVAPPADARRGSSDGDAPDPPRPDEPTSDADDGEVDR